MILAQPLGQLLLALMLVHSAFGLLQSDALIPFSFQLGDPVMPAILLGTAVVPAFAPGAAARRVALSCLLAGGLVALHSLSSWIVVGALTERASRSTRFFVAQDELTAFEALQARQRGGDLVLCSYETALRLPTCVSARVLVGHYASSPFAERLRAELASFLGGALSPSDMAELLERHAVDWIFLGPAERARILPRESALGLTVEFDAGGYRILRVGRER